MIKRVSFAVLAAALASSAATPAMAGGKVVRWNSGAAVETTSFKDVKKFVKKGITPVSYTHLTLPTKVYV